MYIRRRCIALEAHEPYFSAQDLQKLQVWTDAFVEAITNSTKFMPYSMRYLARETLMSLRVCFASRGFLTHALTIGEVPECSRRDTCSMLGKISLLSLFESRSHVGINSQISSCLMYTIQHARSFRYRF